MNINAAFAANTTAAKGGAFAAAASRSVESSHVDFPRSKDRREISWAGTSHRGAYPSHMSPLDPQLCQQWQPLGAEQGSTGFVRKSPLGIRVAIATRPGTAFTHAFS